MIVLIMHKHHVKFAHREGSRYLHSGLQLPRHWPHRGIFRDGSSWSAGGAGRASWTGVACPFFVPGLSALVATLTIRAYGPGELRVLRFWFNESVPVGNLSDTGTSQSRSQRCSLEGFLEGWLVAGVSSARRPEGLQGIQ